MKKQRFHIHYNHLEKLITLLMARGNESAVQQKEPYNKHIKKCKSKDIEISSHSSQNGDHQEHKQQQMLVRMPGKKEPYNCWWACDISATATESSMEFLKKLKIELLYDPVTPLLGICPKNK
jgi:hypothetical protein